MARFMMATAFQVNRVHLPADHLKEATRRAFWAMIAIVLLGLVTDLVWKRVRNRPSSTPHTTKEA